MTLLLGPPGCGKTTLMLALAGTLEKNLEVFSQLILAKLLQAKGHIRKLSLYTTKLIESDHNIT